MQHKKYTLSSGFTLVELVVVATILAILWAVGFSAYTWYIAWVRDTNRIVQLEKIRSGLQSQSIKWDLPMPTDYITINNGLSVLGYQWQAWEIVLNAIGLKKWWKDPLDGSYFTYYLHENRTSFQLLAYLEEEKSIQAMFTEPSMFDSSYALDYSERYPTVLGDSLWIFLWTGINKNVPINEIQAVKDISSIDVSTTTEPYEAIIKNNYTISGDSTALEAIVILWKTKWKIWKNCKDLIDSNSGLLWKDWEYLISQDWENFLKTDCNMTHDGWGWTRYTQYDSSGYYVHDVWNLVKDFNDLFYAYKRGTSDSYAFKFTSFYTQQCGNIHGDVNDVRKGMREYVDHIENKSWGSCWRNATPGDANDIAIQKIIWGKFSDDPCVTWTLNKTTERNYYWGSSTTTDGKSIWAHRHRISDRTILFGPQSDWSSRCDWSSAWPSASEVYIYLR
jgi:prepilin-type N-terminal cleavage/methylation domain-containing protein